MPQLIQMRQRIQSVDTIEKITHAMRLVAMSTLTRLRADLANLQEYTNILGPLYYTLAQQHITWQHPHLQRSTMPHELIIVAGAQKGLCGTFNTMITDFFEQVLVKHHNAHIISIGRKITESIKPLLKKSNMVIASFDNLHSGSAAAIVHQSIKHILQSSKPYTHVIVISAQAPTFFNRYALATTLLPFSTTTPNTPTVATDDYIWEQNPYDLLSSLFEQMLSTHLHTLLLQSLVAEHSTRFVSMDNATRNAKDLKEQMRLAYNKARQAKITKELTELSGSFSGSF